MKICFIYESGFANNNGSNHLLCSIIEKMLEKGHQVHLIESVAIRDNPDYPKQLEHPNFFCHTIDMPIIKKTQFVKRYLLGMAFAVKAQRIYRNLDFDLFFIQSSPTILFTVLKAYRLKKPIVYNIHDIFPGSAYDIGVLKNRVLDRIFRFLQKFAYRRCEKIIAMSDDMKEKLLEENVPENKIVVINSWFDSDSVKYISNEENTFIKEYNIDCSKLIIQFAGNVGQVFGLYEFATLVNLLKDNKDIQFHIIGSGVKLDLLKELTNTCNNILFFPWQHQSRMSEIYSYCDIEIIPLHKGVIGNDVPSKIALAMSCGKPILNIVERSHYFDMFEENTIGFSFEHDEIYLIKSLLQKILDDKNMLKKYEDYTKNFAISYFSKSKNTDLVLKCIEDLFNN